MAKMNEEDVSIINDFNCEDCGEEVYILHIRGKYITAGSGIVPVLFSAGGGYLGQSAGIAALGTATTATWPLAAVGALAGSTAVYVAGATKDSLQCPFCESNIRVE